MTVPVSQRINGWLRHTVQALKLREFCLYTLAVVRAWTPWRVAALFSTTIRNRS